MVAREKQAYTLLQDNHADEAICHRRHIWAAFGILCVGVIVVSCELAPGKRISLLRAQAWDRDQNELDLGVNGVVEIVRAVPKSGPAALRPPVSPSKGWPLKEAPTAVAAEVADAAATAVTSTQPTITRRTLCGTPLAPALFGFCSEWSPATTAEAVPTGNYRAAFAVKNLDGGGSGKFTVEVHPDWAPIGADRFSELVQKDFFKGVRFFRVVNNFVAQFGIAADPEVSREWRSKRISDDPVKVTNSRGTLSFATSGPNTRTTQIFINLKDNQFLDGNGFSPFARVVDGMDVVDRLFSGYGEGAPRGTGPNQNLIQDKGNSYLNDLYPDLTFIERVTIL